MFFNVLISLLFGVCFAAEFQILNREIGDIWVGIQGNPGHPHLSNGGFVLQPGQKMSIQAPENWAGRFWARTWCNSRTKHCETGDCGNRLHCRGAGGQPPVTVAEITLKGHEGVDFYDISLVDGFNIMAAIEPFGGRSNSGRYSCKKSACQVRLNDVCPSKLKMRNRFGVIACNSACNAFNTDQYCCRGAFGTPRRCKSSTWNYNYPQFFKSHCPDAYSYAYDDHKNTFTCRAKSYRITFGG